MNEELKQLVQEEIANLKKYATKEELSKLDFECFNGLSPTSCIYGQMTGYCNNARAVDLIRLSCERVYIPGDGAPNNHKGLNGSPKDKPRVEDGKYQFWSPIEVIVAYNNEEINAKIIEQLKADL